VKYLLGLAAALAFLLSPLTAQHLEATASFSGTPNGDVEVKLTLNNADTADSGVGSINSVNGTTANIPVTWSRNPDGDITISVDSNPHLHFAKCPRNTPYNSFGDAWINDGAPPSPGGWIRTN
jgi:hypothetical protein